MDCLQAQLSLGAGSLVSFITVLFTESEAFLSLVPNLRSCASLQKLKCLSSEEREAVKCSRAQEVQFS